VIRFERVFLKREALPPAFFASLPQLMNQNLDLASRQICIPAKMGAGIFGKIQHVDIVKWQMRLQERSQAAKS